ncbi:MAG: hypothetical protein WEE51_02920, partial [Pirellulaceae bacterium]
MNTPLALFGILPGISLLLYAMPLIVVVSLVYAATRHEVWQPILKHALDTGIWITGFMGVVFVVLLFLGWG